MSQLGEKKNAQAQQTELQRYEHCIIREAAVASEAAVAAVSECVLSSVEVMNAVLSVTDVQEG
jgi:hypothetical protein